MDEEAQVPANSASPDLPIENRIILRFPTLRWKTRPPTEFMNIDEALDRLGVRDFPLEWGTSPAWGEAPYNYEPQSKRFFKYALLKKNGGYYLDKRRFKSSLTRDELKQCSRVYGSVRKALSAALTSYSVSASKLFFDGTIEEIPNHQQGIWATQMRSIFYTGYAREPTGGLERRFRVLIQRATFDSWVACSPEDRRSDQTVSSEVSKNGSETSRKRPSKQLLERIARALEARAREAEYALLRDPLSKLVRDVLAEEMYDLSDRQFRIALWSSSDLVSFTQPGRRRIENSAKFEADGPNLRLLIKEEVRRLREGGNLASGAEQSTH